jgi:hypothetical protein
MRPRYVRFVTAAIDEYSGKRQGVFQAMSALIESREAPEHELEELHAIRKWFNERLRAPKRFARSRRRYAAPKAICWYKSTATVHVRRMHPICRILNGHDIRTEMITSLKPGYIVFEDEHQVTAVPFWETRT